MVSIFANRISPLILLLGETLSGHPVYSAIAGTVLEASSKVTTPRRVAQDGNEQSR